MRLTVSLVLLCLLFCLTIEAINRHSHRHSQHRHNKKHHHNHEEHEVEKEQHHHDSDHRKKHLPGPTDAIRFRERMTNREAMKAIREAREAAKRASRSMEQVEDEDYDLDDPPADQAAPPADGNNAAAADPTAPQSTMDADPTVDPAGAIDPDAVPDGSSTGTMTDEQLVTELVTAALAAESSGDPALSNDEQQAAEAVEKVDATTPEKPVETPTEAVENAATPPPEDKVEKDAQEDLAIDKDAQTDPALADAQNAQQEAEIATTALTGGNGDMGSSGGSADSGAAQPTEEQEDNVPHELTHGKFPLDSEPDDLLDTYSKDITKVEPDSPFHADEETCCVDGQKHFCGDIFSDDDANTCGNLKGQWIEGSGCSGKLQCCQSPVWVDDDCDNMPCKERNTYQELPETEDGDRIKINKLDCMEADLRIVFDYFNRFPDKKQFHEERDLKTIDTIVIHEGDSVDKVVTNPEWKKAGYSTHFAIERDGTVFQLMDTAHIAHHTGSKVLEKGHKGATCNARSIGIDLQTGTRKKPCQTCPKDNDKVNNTDCTYAKPLLNSLKKLLTCLNKQIPTIKLDYQHVIGHREFGVHGDPRNFPWAAYMEIGIDGSKKQDKGWMAMYGPNQDPKY